MAPRDVFISHSSADAETAREIRAVLEASGYTCWMAPDDIVGTRTWTEQILDAINESKVMVVLVSAAAQASEHVSREVNLALGRKRALMPIRIENVPPEGPLEYLLSLVQRLDAFPPPIANHGPRILRRLEAILERPLTAPLPGRAADETGPVTKPEPVKPRATSRTRGKAKAAGEAEIATKPEAADSAGTASKPGTAGKPDAGRDRPTEGGAAGAAAGGVAGAAGLAAGGLGGVAEGGAASAARGGLPSAAAGSSPQPAPGAPSDPAAPASAPPPRRTSVEIGPGSVIGGFTIESQLGEGGMATVYRARQEEPRRLVALKVIRADHSANATYRRRFLEEKETLAALEHPSIVPIYAAGEADGVLYIAMRLVDGPDLQARIKRQGHLSLRETVQILEPIADAVDYAHAMSVVHRDLKPSNVILDRDNRPYLTDFGLGKRLEIDSQVSLPGMAIGTLDYMAPEQFTGKADAKLAPAIDLYALGCVAFQCLTGQAPFVRETPDQLMYAHAHEAPPQVTSLRPEYPPVVDSIFEKVLAKDPASRYGSAREFIADLDRVAASAAAHVTSPVVVPDRGPTSQARRWVGRNTAIAVGGGAVALVAAVALGAGLIFSPGASPSPQVTVAPTERTTPAPPTAGPPTAPPPTPTPPTPTRGPDGFPTSAEAYLIEIQPSPLVDRATCTRFQGTISRALGAISCFAPAGSARQVLFATFNTSSDMDATFNEIMVNVGAEASTTGCFDLVASNNSWSYVGTDSDPEGRLACFPWTDAGFSGIEYVWTHTDRLILALWITTDYQTGLDYFDDWVSGVRQ